MLAQIQDTQTGEKAGKLKNDTLGENGRVASRLSSLGSNELLRDAESGSFFSSCLIFSLS